MARGMKVLTLVDDALEIADVDEINGAASMQYGVGGVGTIVMEYSSVASGPDEWIQLKLFNPAATVNAEVDNLAAAGVGWSDIIGAKKVRARKTVAGPGNVTVTLTVNNQ